LTLNLYKDTVKSNFENRTVMADVFLVDNELCACLILVGIAIFVCVESDKFAQEPIQVTVD